MQITLFLLGFTLKTFVFND